MLCEDLARCVFAHLSFEDCCRVCRALLFARGRAVGREFLTLQYVIHRSLANVQEAVRRLDAQFHRLDAPLQWRCVAAGEAKQRCVAVMFTECTFDPVELHAAVRDCFLEERRALRLSLHRAVMCAPVRVMLAQRGVSTQAGRADALLTEVAALPLHHAKGLVRGRC